MRILDISPAEQISDDISAELSAGQLVVLVRAVQLSAEQIDRADSISIHFPDVFISLQSTGGDAGHD